ncbi:hypothetical protein H4S04_008611 [Coemansia sp. S16]|nr:hypothetical protein LPJ71_006208 [Coemansia sp. S17]KAJ2037283.1 hypothetical protein H4S04_008611 [Coemansia sp. S16]KAJ2040180.1 hypothetical protein H4S03_001204 [Coemansia sp. S3946]KAJ2095434.1 hypothetical protein GGI16_005212 [Coemansia sp. S142-1]KAJ2351212.1 hypothetical protein GGH92_001951 [Coemansia sp. RSA 2673]
MAKPETTTTASAAAVAAAKGKVKPSHTEVLKRRVKRVKKLKEFKKNRQQKFQQFKAAAKKIPRSERTAVKKVKVKNQKKNEVPAEMDTAEAKAEKKRIHDLKIAAKRNRRVKRKEVKKNKKKKKMAGVEERKEKRVAERNARKAQTAETGGD